MNEDTNQQILRELRSLRRHTQFTAYFTVLLVAAGTSYITWLRIERERSWRAYYQSRSATQAASSPQASPEAVWPSIEAALDQGDNQKALSIAQSFAARQPSYHYSHATLGVVYVAMGDFTNAEAAYSRAVELFPNEENEKVLTAIRKRLSKEPGTQGQVK